MPRHKDVERDQIQAETRQLLLEAAVRAFAHAGYAGAKVDAISKDAGFAKGTIYNYFASKRELMVRLLEEIASAHFRYVSERVLQETLPERRLARFFEAGFAWAADNLEQGRVMLSVLYGADRGFRQHLGDCYAPFFQLVGEEILAPGMKQGGFQVADLRETAALLMTIYLGTSTQFDEAGKLWLDPESVSGFILRALRTSDPGNERGRKQQPPAE